MMNVSDNIRAIRKEKGLTQTEVARRYGTSPEFYHRLEKKDKTLTIEQLEKIADAMGVTPAELLGYGNQEPTVSIKELQERIEELEKENKQLNVMVGFVQKVMDTVNKNPQQIAQMEHDLFDGDDTKKERIKRKVMNTIGDTDEETK